MAQRASKRERKVVSLYLVGIGFSVDIFTTNKKEGC